MFFDRVLKTSQAVVPEAAEVANPIGDRFETGWLQPIDPLPAPGVDRDQLALFEDREMLLDRRPGHVELIRDFADRHVLV